MVTYANNTPLNPAAHSFMYWSYPNALDSTLTAAFMMPHAGTKARVANAKESVPVLASMAEPALCSVMLLKAMCIKLKWKNAVEMMR